jgi:glutaredoxin 3
MKKVIVYSTEGCAFCMAAKEYLDENKVPFEERNIKNKDFRKELIALGFMSVPIIKIEEDIVLGFDKPRINELLGLNS